MGVDIYLRSVYPPDSDPATYLPAGPLDRSNPVAALNAMYAKAQATGGYFRNAYNTTDVMWVMGLSWHDTVAPMLHGENKGELPIARARELVALIEARPLSSERLTDHYFSKMTEGIDPSPIGHIHNHVAEVLGHPVVPPDFEAWAQHVHAKRETLLALLRKSIDMDEPLVFSM
jgi:hypothetical protein